MAYNDFTRMLIIHPSIILTPSLPLNSLPQSFFLYLSGKLCLLKLPMTFLLCSPFLLCRSFPSLTFQIIWHCWQLPSWNLPSPCSHLYVSPQSRFAAQTTLLRLSFVNPSASWNLHLGIFLASGTQHVQKTEFLTALLQGYSFLRVSSLVCLVPPPTS